MRVVSRIAIGVVLALAGAPVAAQQVTPPEPPQGSALLPGEALISVQAQGITTQRPDLLTITAGVVTAGASARIAIRANSALVQRLIAAARQAGVEERDLQTSQLSVEPRTEQRGYEGAAVPRVLGYVVRNSLSVRFRDVARASTIVGTLLDSGANQVNGPTFSLQDSGPAARSAERNAIAAARAEAENLAAALGKQVGRVLRVVDSRVVEFGPQQYGESAIIVTGSRGSAPPIEAGELEVRATVYVDFALIDR